MGYRRAHRFHGLDPAETGTAYAVSYTAVTLEAVANRTRLLPLEYVGESGSDTNEEYRAYAEPLIGGPSTRYAWLA